MEFIFSYDTNTFHIPDYGSFGYVALAQHINAIDSAITYLADLFKNPFIYAVDKNGKIVENDPLVNLLNNPNHLQGKEEFLSELYYYLTSAGYVFTLPFSKSFGFENDLEKVQLFNLNPDCVNFKDIKADPMELERLDFKYSYEIDGANSVRNLDTTRVIPFYDSIPNSKNPYIGHSRLCNIMDEAINTVLADKGKHNQIKRTGAMVISHKERATDGISDGLDEIIKKTPEGKKITHKEDIERNLNAVGLAQGKSIIVSSKELTGFSLAKDIIGIDFGKMKEDDIRIINNKIGVPDELLPTSNQNATYENREQAQFQVIQNRIEPIANNVARGIKDHFKHDNNIIFSYEHLPAYQVAKTKKEESKNKIVERTERLMNMGVITQQEAKQMLTNYEII